MKILVIGNTSVIGEYIVKYLAQTNLVKTAGRNNNADIFIDLSDINQEINDKIIEQFDVIIHCAAAMGDDTHKAAINNELVNSIGAIKTMQLAEAVKCKHIVYLSSIFVYDHPDNKYFSSYGLSKKHGEDNIKLFCEKTGIKYTILRLSQVYDAEGKCEKHQPLLYNIIKIAKKSGQFNIYGKQDPKRNYLYIEDLVKIIEKVITNQIYGRFPCVSKNNYKISKIIQMAFDSFNKSGEILFNSDRPDINTVYIPEGKELYELTNYNQFVDLKEGIKKIVRAM